MWLSNSLERNYAVDSDILTVVVMPELGQKAKFRGDQRMYTLAPKVDISFHQHKL